MQPKPKSPPHSVDAEVSVIGGLLLNNGLWPDVSEILHAEDFYRADHQILFRHVAEILNSGGACDFVTLADLVRRRGQIDAAGGASYIGSLTDAGSIANALAYAKIVKEHALRRNVIAAGAEIGDLGYAAGDVAYALDRAHGLIQAIGEARKTGAPAPIADAMPAWMSELERRRQAGSDLAGLSTGFADLDRKTSGLQAGDFVILAARPSMGKTGLALNMASNVARNGRPCLFFSAEMPRAQLVSRVVSASGRVKGEALRFPKSLTDADFDRISEVTRMVNGWPLLVDDQAGLTITDIRARAKKEHRRRPLSLIVIDYLQLIAPEDAENRTQEVRAISQGLKYLAKELAVPVLALSQLNRGLESRPDKRPRLADLRESGDLEQDADTVMMLYRDEVYNTGSQHAGIAELIIEKQRMGPTGVIELAWLPDFCLFTGYAGPAFHDRAPALSRRSRGFTAPYSEPREVNL